MLKKVKADLAGSVEAAFTSCIDIADVKSSPAVKCLPSPLRMIQRTSLLFKLSTAVLSSAKVAQVSELNFFGRLIVTIAT